MQYIFIKSNNLMENADELINFIKDKYPGKILILNLTRENRHLETSMGIQDLIIYNSYDYIKGICNLDRAIQYSDNTIDIAPSTIKNEKISLVFQIFIDDLKDLILYEDLDEEYEAVIVIDSEINNNIVSSLKDVEILDFESLSKANDRDKQTGFIGKFLKFLGIKSND